MVSRQTAIGLSSKLADPDIAAPSRELADLNLHYLPMSYKYVLS